MCRFIESGNYVIKQLTPVTLGQLLPGALRFHFYFDESDISKIENILTDVVSEKLDIARFISTLFFFTVSLGKAPFSARSALILSISTH